MKKYSAWILAFGAAAFLNACGPLDTPSMMNTSLPRLEQGATLEQIPADKVSEGYLYKLSSDYDRYGSGPVQLTLVYDPASKTYGTTKAFKDMATFKDKLAEFGVKSVKADVLKAEKMEPTLMVSYESIKAQPPAGCRNMPGFDDGMSTRHINDYKFGCSIDTVMAKQIYRPADLAGNEQSDPIDGRRAANNAEYYRRVSEDEADGELRVYSRDDIQQ